ncbi:unnamed protein product [Lepeophtheirus salmonis]|uniref:(salmon louse) hypothetical protein n=1 Tax=Lepeophtheirus salmonis TaxID=72036 RepID=A0A7R8CSY1_LEPSM|nr:unnamed protein product [Lepeophtheirus salmonis]CAF2918300.1 unnamed protein product [Lepeophtheirus salmonis]
MMGLNLLILFLTGGLLSVNAVPSPMDHLSLVLDQIGEIMIVCETKPTSCACGNGQTLSGENFFPGIYSCNPTSCECPNGLTVEGLDTIVVEEVLTPEMYSRIMSLGSVMGYWSRIEHQYQSFCNGEAPESCRCADGDTFTDFTKNVRALIICRPEECTCSDGVNKTIPDTLKYSFFRSHGEDLRCKRLHLLLKYRFQHSSTIFIHLGI